VSGAPSWTDRLLDERTQALAVRGRAAPEAETTVRLVCEAQDRLWGLDAAIAATVLPARWTVLPPFLRGRLRGAADSAFLGLFEHRGHAGSLFDLATLAGAAGPFELPPGGAGHMLLLRSLQDGLPGRVALRVDRVLGLLPLRAAGRDGSDPGDPALAELIEPRTAPDGAGPAADARFVSLLSSARLLADLLPASFGA
jgi:hypothetical protein